MFKEKDYWPFIAGVVLIGGLLVLPLIIQHMASELLLDDAEYYYAGFIVAAAFALIHNRNGSVNIAKLILILAVLAGVYVKVYASGKAFVILVPGAISIALLYVCGWLGIIVGRITKFDKSKIAVPERIIKTNMLLEKYFLTEAETNKIAKEYENIKKVDHRIHEIDAYLTKSIALIKNKSLQDCTLPLPIYLTQGKELTENEIKILTIANAEKLINGVIQLHPQFLNEIFIGWGSNRRFMFTEPGNPYFAHILTDKALYLFDNQGQNIDRIELNRIIEIKCKGLAKIKLLITLDNNQEFEYTEHAIDKENIVNSIECLQKCGD